MSRLPSRYGWSAVLALVCLGVCHPDVRGFDRAQVRQGLHAAALASDGKHFVGIAMIEVELIATDLAVVADVADVVIRGTIGENLTRLARDSNGNETVVLDYKVEVHEVFAGPPELLTQGIVLTVPGGRFEFGDGASVEILTPGFRKPFPGEEFVLYLAKDPIFGHHALAFGTQSLFRLNENGTVEAQANADYPTGQGILPEARRLFLDRVAGSVVAGYTPRPRPDLSKGPQMQAEKRRLVEVRVKEGLKAAAKLDGGGYVDYVDFDYELDADGIAVLVDSADTIVRGIVMKNRCLLVRGYVGYAEPVETIVTDYTISVFDVYKGNPGLHARDITVRVPGGRVEFGDGLWAETSTGDFLPPLNLQEFILFLSPHESEKGVYVPTNNRLGMFEVEPGGRVTPRARSETLLARSVKRGYAEFVAEVRARIARTKPR